jgi:hypothetical protein
LWSHSENPAIVFCTTCKGRAQHIKQTLPQNLADNRRSNTKFILLDYNSPDDLAEYLWNEHADDIDSGQLTVYAFRGEGPFHVSHAKNIAARCGVLEGADILVTLDADNFTRGGFTDFVMDKFNGTSEPRTFVCPNFTLIQSLPHGPDRPLRGYAGRLAIRAADFIKAGGYDETFDTWRGEDIDMISRLLRMGWTMQHFDNKYLGVVPHGSDIRFKEYPHARKFENRRETRVIYERKETVVNYGKFGLGTVYRNYDTEVRLDAVPTRVFGIGMHKTATTSLHKAFEILDMDSFHWGRGEAPVIWHEMQMMGRSPTMERWYAFADLPFPLLYRKLDKAYPGSKFVLTVREEGRWLKSVEKLWDIRSNPTRWVWDVYPFTNKIHTEMYGRRDFHAQTFIERYRRHNAEVIEYFKGRPGDLLIMDMDAGAGWEELCSFLGKPVPTVDYPVAYTTEENVVASQRRAERRPSVESPFGAFGKQFNYWDYGETSALITSSKQNMNGDGI